jgi:hypothetical protein
MPATVHQQKKGPNLTRFISKFRLLLMGRWRPAGLQSRYLLAAGDLPACWFAEASKKLTGRVLRSWPSLFLPCMKALLLQGFLNFLVVDNFYARVGRIHVPLLFCLMV